jgi:signal transduction histidine kinase
MESSKRIIYSRIIFITGLILLTSMSVLFVYETYQENTSASVIQNTNAIRHSLEAIFHGEKQREIGLLQYALTKDSTSWMKVRPTFSLYQHLIKIDSLIGDNPARKRNHAKLANLLDSGIHQQNAIALKLHGRKYSNSPGFYNDFKNYRIVTDSLRQHIDKMHSVATSISKLNELNVQKHTIIATMMGVTASIFSMIIFILAFYFIDQELKRSRNYLEETQTLNTKIAEINKELEDANSSLLQLNSELESKNLQLQKYAAELSSFTRITSHDMQEPLRKIEFYISIVDDREKMNLSDEGRKFLDKIKQSVTRMRQLFLSMLDFSLTNTVDNHIEDIELEEVFSQTLHSLKVYINDTNAIIECQPLPRVKGIKYQLIQLFENLVSNAIKFRKQDTVPEIQIGCSVVHMDGKPLPGLKKNKSYYKIDFEDNGVGFDPQYAERIFEIFQRLISKTDSYGVGIGLAISRKIAENHGGTLLAESKPGQGSVFSLYIPVS